MVSPSSRRRAVKLMVKEGVGRAPKPAEPWDWHAAVTTRCRIRRPKPQMRQRIVALSQKHPRYCYRRITALLSVRGWRSTPSACSWIKVREQATCALK